MVRTCRAAWLAFRATRVLLLLAVGAGIPVVSAPRGLPLSLEGVRSSCSDGGASGNANAADTVAAMSAAAAAAAVALQLRRRSSPATLPSWCSPGATTQPRPNKFGGDPVPFGASDSGDEQLSEQLSDGSVAGTDEDSDDALPTPSSTAGGTSGSAGGTSGSGKLWSKAQFPEGTQGAQNYEMANLMAAQQWSCPCPDRDNCIGQSRLSVLRPPRDVVSKHGCSAKDEGALLSASGMHRLAK